MARKDPILPPDAENPGPDLVLDLSALVLPAAPLGMRYLSDGSAFLSGVPARDLTADEWAGLSDSLRRLCVTTQLYAPIEATA